MPKLDFRARVDWHLASALTAARSEWKSTLAEHSAAGRLQSGATLRATVRIWAKCSTTAISKALPEIGSLIEKRGKEWSNAMSDALAAIDAHRASAEQDMATTLRVAHPPGGDEGSAMVAVRGLLDTAAEDMRQQVIAYRDGWTAPRPRTWNERHPVLFALIMAVVGAILALAGQALLRRVFTPPTNAQQNVERLPSP